MFKEKDLETEVKRCQRENACYCLNNLCYLSIGPRYVPCKYFERFKSARIGFNDNNDVLITIYANYCNYTKIEEKAFIYGGL